MTFENILLEAIDEGLACLGEQTKKAVYQHLKNKYSLSKQDIPYRIEDFTKAIEDIFQAGAKLLEIKIMKILYTKIGNGYVSLENSESLEFTNYIYAIRNSNLCILPNPPRSQAQRNCDL
jgi:hypothetical protein